MSKRTKPTIENVSQLRYQLTELWDKIWEGEIEDAKADRLNKTASNILKTISVQDNHAQINGLINKIDFMEVDATQKKNKRLVDEVFGEKPYEFNKGLPKFEKQ